MHRPQQFQHQYQQHPSQSIPTNAQRYVYVDPGRQPYINPAHIQRNQNYYRSPIIQNPPVQENASSYGLTDPYANYYYNYYNNPYQYGNCGCQGQYGYYGQPQYGYGTGYSGYPCSPCTSYAGYSAPAYGTQGCGCTNCAEYGLSINRERLTPKFPQKLGHSFVTSGNRVQDKLVINQPTVQSAPFQTQRRKTYVPFTRKYIQYQDYIQYIPVQKSEWQYKKIMKQIDFVPQQYYQTSVEVVPRERLDHRVRYLPVEQQIVHVPEDKMAPPRQSTLRQVTQDKFITTGNISNPSSFGNASEVRFIQKNTAGPLRTSGFVRPNYQAPVTETISSNFQQRLGPLIVRPAESTVEMVSNTRFQPPQNQVAPPNSGAFGALNKESSYQFPSSGGVMIGSSSQTQSKVARNILQTFGSTGGLLEQAQNPVTRTVEVSQVVNSGTGNYPFMQTRTNRSKNIDQTQYARNLRESERVESEDYHLQRLQNQKKMSIVNRFDEE